MGKKSRNNSLRTVTKASGVVEPYTPEKLRRSLVRAGASEPVVRLVMSTVEDSFVPGISTRALYRLAHEELRRVARPAAARYSLRRATLALGPSGYPFEHLVAALFASDGYTTQVGRIVQGRCVGHEVDVVAARTDRHTFVECKFHSQLGFRTDVKVALYVQARALDLRENPANALDAFWLVTNSKFTTDALKYGMCAGLQLLGWDHPEGNGLQERLERARVLPITCATALKSTAKKRLLESGVVTTNQLLRRPELLEGAGVRGGDVERVLTELQGLEDVASRPLRGEAGPPYA